MTFIKEFKEFAVKGNMMDMAVGIIIGASFNKVIDVLVKKVFMPPLSLMTNGLDFQNNKYVLKEAVISPEGTIITAESAIEYGTFLEVSLDFLIVGLTVFLVVKAMNRLRNDLAMDQLIRRDDCFYPAEFGSRGKKTKEVTEVKKRVNIMKSIAQAPNITMLTPEAKKLLQPIR